MPKVPKKHNKKAFKPLDYNLSEEKSQPYLLKAYDKTLHHCGGQIFIQLQQLCCPFQETNFNFLIVFVLKPVFLIIFHKDCAREWTKHRKTGDRFIHADEIRDFLKTDTTVFKYKFGNKWIVNYDQLLPHLKKINRRESKLWKAYMARIGIKKSVTPRKK